MSKYFVPRKLSFLGALFLFQASSAHEQYWLEPIHQWLCQGKRAYLGLRQAHNPELGLAYWAVDTRTLETKWLLHPQACSAPAHADQDPYFRLLHYPYVGQRYNVGWTGVQSSQGYYLTMDLCPSHHFLDTAQILRFLPKQGALNLGLAVSGDWIVHHSADLLWLRNLEAGKRLKVTWINHSNHHRVSAGRDPMFLQAPGTDLKEEFLATEERMIQRGMLPSIFVRFPGLEADSNVWRESQNLGLIPLGAGTWVAKSQAFKRGNVLLFHANGNEPHGWKIWEDSAATRKWSWRPLGDLARLPAEWQKAKNRN